ncbi:MAG TPA: signal peptidase I [Egibacteraceae bacterium]|jgi:signal peptidase I|nr:signal peptidase I [Egibacteraceae bacterium]
MDTEAGARSGAEEEARERGRSFFAELPVLILVAFVLALLLKTFLVQAFYIPSSSMEPTLHIDDRVLVNKLSYQLREPRRGELVVFTERVEGADGHRSVGERVMHFLSSGLGVARPDERDYIKRIIGLPGETVEMRNGVVRINGEPLPEATTEDGGYLSAPDHTPFGPVEVPSGHYFMMGDNRPNSADSRSSLGPIAGEDLVGRAFVVIWPLQRVDTLPIADYAEEPERGRATATVGP